MDRHSGLIAATLALSFVAQPVVATSCLAAAAAPDTRAPAPRGMSEPRAAERIAVASRLVELGSTPAEAELLVAQLTAEDIAVLCANPGMMQKAGEMDAQTRNIILGLLLLGALIAIAIAADGSIVSN